MKSSTIISYTFIQAKEKQLKNVIKTFFYYCMQKLEANQGAIIHKTNLP